MAKRIVLRRLMLLIAILVSAVPAFAQSVRHDISGGTPDTIGIYMIGEGTGQRAVDSGNATDVTSCVSAEDTVARLPATSVNRFDDVEVSDVGFRHGSVYGDQRGGSHATPGTYYLTSP